MSPIYIGLTHISFEFNDPYRLRNVFFSMIATIVETDVSSFSMTADFVFVLWLVHRSGSIAKS
jgi:hypothetical protein